MTIAVPSTWLPDNLASTVLNLAALKALTLRPALVLTQGYSTVDDGGGGFFIWIAGDSTTADDAIYVQCTAGPAGRYKRFYEPKVISLGWFLGATNPLQAALDYLGVEGGTILVPNGETSLPTAATSIDDLRGLKILGMGTDFVLIWPNNTDGLILNMVTPSGTEEARDQVLVQGVSFLKNFFGANTGIGLGVYYETGVGDVSLGVTVRNCNFGPKDHNASGGNYAYWDVGIELWNARNNRIENCAIFGGTSQFLGTGIRIDGNTVSTAVEASYISDGGKAVHVRGTAEGVVIGRCDIVGTEYYVWIDGNEAGSVLTTSTTSFAIGTGSKTFTIADSGMAWEQTGLGLYIRSAANPTVNFMVGTITAYTGTNSVTVNVTSVGGSGTHTDWSLSPEHSISDVKIHDGHGSCTKGQVYANWTAFLYFHDMMTQKREGTSENYIDILFDTHIDTFFIHDNYFSARGAGGTEVGVNVGGTTNGNGYVNNNHFSSRDTAVVISAGISAVYVHHNIALNDVTTFITNAATPASKVNVVDNVNMTLTNIMVQFSANDATPDVGAPISGGHFYTNNSVPTSITDFDGGYPGQTITVKANDANTTYNHTANLNMQGGINYAAPNGSYLTFLRENTTQWTEIGRRT